MTATHETLARPASLGNAVIGSPDAPPLIVSLGVAALGLITLLSLVPARRGNRGALTAVVVTRVISAVLAVPAFFLNAPAWSRRSRDSSSPPRSPPWSWCTSRADGPHEDAGPAPPADGHSAAAREACATAGPPPR